MKQSNSFQPSDSQQDLDQFTSFDNEQHLRRLAARRHARGLKSVQLPDTHDWVFGAELDMELEALKSQFIQSHQEVISCH